MSEFKVGDKVAAAVMASRRAEMRVGVIERIHPHSRYVGQRYTLRMQNGMTSVVSAARIVRVESDDYHTMGELYEFRMLFNAHLFNEWFATNKYPVVKSRHHHDGNPAGGEGWFIVVATLPSGQISNHYPDRFWDLFQIDEVERAPEFDGHTKTDVATRLLEALQVPAAL